MIIDANVQPHFRDNAEIRRYLPAAHQLRAIPDVETAVVPGPGRRLPPGPLRRALPRVRPRNGCPASFRRRRGRLCRFEPVDPRQHCRLSAQQPNLRRGQRLAARPMAGARHHQPFPRHHPGQPRGPQGCGRRDRAPGHTSQAGAGRCSHAVPRALRQTDVRADLGGRRGPRASGGRSHQRRQRRRLSADVRRSCAYLSRAMRPSCR